MLHNQEVIAKTQNLQRFMVAAIKDALLKTNQAIQSWSKINYEDRLFENNLR